MNSKSSATVLQKWHEFAKNGNTDELADLLADDAVFHSPVVHRPQEGKALVTLYLTAAASVLGSDSFKYLREIVEDRQAVLEFECEVDGILINGVDIITWNSDDKIIDFKVMVRPLKGVNMIHQKMMAMLEKFQPDKNREA